MIDKRSDEGVEWYAAWMDCWEMICKAFPNAKPEDGTGDVYADRLCDLSPTLLRAAVEQVICTHEYGNWLPTIAAIRIAARSLSDPVSTSSLEVWGATMAEIAASMTERRPMKLAPDVKKLVDALGGRKLILDEPKPAIIRAQFLKAYERNQAEAERIRTMTPIARQYVPELTALTDGADA